MPKPFLPFSRELVTWPHKNQFFAHNSSPPALKTRRQPHGIWKLLHRFPWTTINYKSRRHMPKILEKISTLIIDDSRMIMRWSLIWPMINVDAILINWTVDILRSILIIGSVKNHHFDHHRSSLTICWSSDDDYFHRWFFWVANRSTLNRR